MQLTDEQANQVRQWAGEGATLGQIQKRLDEEFGITMTFMETRFLLSDLDIHLKEPEKPKEPEVPTEIETPGDEPAGGTGGVSVTLDEITKPNNMASGKVTFSDGETAEWYIDQLGQLGLNPSKPDYRPSDEDVMAFQKELQEAARRAGL